MRAPSPSRWRAFSVRPPSASVSSVSATVSNRNAASRSARRPAGSVRIVVDRADRAAPDAHRRPGGRDRRAPRARPATRPWHQGSARTIPGAGHGVTRSMLPQGGQTVGRTSLPTIAGRPRRNSTQGIRRPPAGWTSWSSERAVAGRQPARAEAPGRQVLARRRARRPDGQPPAAASRRRSRATAGRPGPGARAPRRAATGRGARPRGATAVSGSRPVGCGCSRISPRSHGSSDDASRSAPIAASLASAPARSRRARRASLPGRRSDPCRGPRPCA